MVRHPHASARLSAHRVLLCYIGTNIPAMPSQFTIERVQTGVRLEKRLLKVLKALADYHDISLGDLLEGIVLHAFDGTQPFSDESRKKIRELKRVFELSLDARHAHRLTERAGDPP